jgi:hypothetical protein
MKTEQLIDQLSANLEPADGYKLIRGLSIAAVAGLVLASLICIFTLGVRPDLNNPGALAFLSIKAGFAAVISIVGWSLLLSHSRPGGERHSRILSAGIPFVVVLALALLNLALVPASHWDQLVRGERLLQCVLSIPIMAIVPFAGIVWALRNAAPTNLLRTGALVGLVAGGIGAMAYALHCPNDSLPFVAFWYGGAIVLCTLAGAALGPRLLRW